MPNTTIAAADIRPGQTVATIPSRASGRTTETVFTVAEIESYVIEGQMFYDLRSTDGDVVTNMSGTYRLVSEA